jgi:pantoate kinase
MNGGFIRADAYSPAGITSFFEILDEQIDGTSKKNPLQIGARGGGFVIEKGVLTRAFVKEFERSKIDITINGKKSPEAETTKEVVRTLIKKTEQNYRVKIEHEIAVPIESGFGTSGAGALSAALAMNEVLGLGLTYNELGRIAHIAEIKCNTGLGTVGPIMLGGCILTIEGGAPGFNVIDRIPLNPNYKIISIHFGKIPTKNIITNHKIKLKINKWGKMTLNDILREPNIENFMISSKKFADKIGLMTKNVSRAIKLMESAGAIGATQNMIGESVHSVVDENSAEKVTKALKKIGKNIIVTNIDIKGARLI